jgi:hypothetical protein
MCCTLLTQRPFHLPRGHAWQDNFVSHTMKAEQEANLERINERKSKSDVTHPLEPLIMSLIKGFVDDKDMSHKIKALYRVRIGNLREYMDCMRVANR